MQSIGIREQHWAISKNCSDYLGLPSQCSIICQISFYQESNNEQNIAFPISREMDFCYLITKLYFVDTTSSLDFICGTVTQRNLWFLNPYSICIVFIFMFWDYLFLNMLIMLPVLTESCSSGKQGPCKQGTVRRGNIDKED